MYLSRLGIIVFMLMACGENLTVISDTTVDELDMHREQDLSQTPIADVSTKPDLSVRLTDAGLNNRCGNGVIDGSESCDDGNLQPGDGCAPDCQVEPGYNCSEAPSDCRPAQPCSPNHNPCSENATCLPSDWQAVCTCDEDFYGNGLECTPLTTCALNEYETVPPGSSNDRECDNCDATCLTCTGGTTSECASCAAGRYFNSGRCLLVSTCDENGAQTVPPTATSDRECACAEGYTGSGYTCSDVDECDDGTAICVLNAQCQNTIGSYNCHCIDGFTSQDGQCVHDPCFGLDCTRPPTSKCVPTELPYPLTPRLNMSHQLTTYSDAPGACVAGQCIYEVESTTECEACCYGASVNPTGDPIGGGVGYSDILSVGQATRSIQAGPNAASELVDALENAQDGDIIFIHGDAEIELTGYSNILVPGGVTIASNRGRDGSTGARIWTAQYNTRPLFRTNGDHIRFTGLEISGPNPFMGDHHYTAPIELRSDAIRTTHDFLEVDNCNIWGFGYAGVNFSQNANQGYVHHNYMHHTQLAGLGYSVVINQSDALIEANRFNNGRHHIASSGRPGSSYEARYNLILENANSHHFDMHGARDYEKYNQMAIYRLDESDGLVADDAATFTDHDCTLTNLDSTAWTQGYVGNAVHVAPSSDGGTTARAYLDCAVGTHLESDKGTLSFLFKRDNTTPQDMDLLYMGNYNNATSYFSDFLLVRLNENGRITMLLEHENTPQFSLGSSIRITDTQWHHLAVIQDGQGVQLFVDGIRDDTLSGSDSGAWTDIWRTNSGSGVEYFRIGSAFWNDGFSGLIDEFRVYDKPIDAETIVRQSVGNGDSAGDFMHIHHNTFMGDHVYAFTLRGRPFIEAFMHHNWFKYENSALITRQINATGNLRVQRNHIGFDDPPNTPLERPSVILESSLPFADPPLNLTMQTLSNSLGSYGVLDTLWHLGGHDWVSGLDEQLIFSDVGKTLLKAQTFNRLGLYQETFLPIEVYPRGSYVLTLKVLDSYRGTLAGKFEIQVLVDGQTIWSDDIEGDENWRHLSLPLAHHFDPASQAKFDLAVRVVALTDVSSDEILELRVAVDDVHVFGGVVNNGTMEVGSGWSYSESETRWSGQYSYIDKFSGHRSFMLMHPYKKDAVGGTYAQIAQRVALTDPLDIFSISFDGQDAYANKDHASYRLDIREPVDLRPQLSAETIMGDRSVLLGAQHLTLAMTEVSPTLANRGFVEFTIHPAQQTQGGNLLSFTKYRGAEPSHVAVHLTADGHIRMSRMDNSIHQFDIRTTTALPLHERSHVLIQQDGTGINVYFDGQQQQTTQVSNGNNWLHGLVTQRFDIGDSQSGSFEGQLAQINLSGRVLGLPDIFNRAQRGSAETQFDFEAPLTEGTELSTTGNGIECQRPNVGLSLIEGVIPGSFAANFDANEPGHWFECATSPAMSTPKGAIMFWIKPDINDQNDHDIIELYQTRYTDYLLVRLNNNRVYVRIEEGNIGLIDLLGTQQLVPGQWHHVAIVQDGHALKVYIDGSLDAVESASSSGAWTNHLSLAGLRIGAGSWGEYIGAIDALTFTSWAPTADQVYNLSRP
jgi:cysteine-rich repeat protein